MSVPVVKTVAQVLPFGAQEPIAEPTRLCAGAIRSRIEAIREEIRCSETKVVRIRKAIETRKQSLSRLEAQLVLNEHGTATTSHE